jgi:hypothetical protein
MTREPIEISLSADEWRGLQWVAKGAVSADYWEDATVRRYRTLGLVEQEGRTIRLSEAGRRAVASAAARAIDPLAPPLSVDDAPAEPEGGDDHA